MNKRIDSIDDFEHGQYYWVKFNCGWLIAQIGFNFKDIDKAEDKDTWILKAVGVGSNALYSYTLKDAITAFVGGIYKAEMPDIKDT